MNLAPSAHEPNPTPTCITEVLRKNKVSTQYRTQQRRHHPGHHRLPPPKNPTPVTPNAAPPPRHPERSIPSPCHSEQRPPLSFRAATPILLIPNAAHLPCHPERSHLHPVIPDAASLPLSCHVIPNTVRNLNSLHLHHSQTSHSSPHSKRHGPISAIPSATLSCLEPLPHSAFRTPPILSFRGPPPVIPNTAPFSPVTLNATQPPLPPVIPNTVRNLNSLHIHHSQTSHSSPHSKRHGPNSAIPNTASLPCHPERSVPSPCHSERSVPSLSF